MADPLTILLFVATGEGSDATTRAMARATREALGYGASVEVRETASELTDDDALVAEQLAHADALVELTWSDPSHRNAALRVHVARSGRWIGRSLGFMASDAGSERGRTIGFAVASMLPEAAGEGQAVSSTPGPEPGPPQSPPASPPVSAPLAEPAAPRDVPLPTPPQGLPSFALDLFGLAATGVGGDGDGAGGGAAFSWFVWAPVSLRLGAGLRAGNINSGVARFATLTATASAGVAWHPMRSTPSHPFGMSLRADYLLVYQSARRVPASSARCEQGARAIGRCDGWLSGIGLVADAAWLFSPDAAAIVGLGLEDVFVTTNLSIQGHAYAAALPPLRAVVEAGVSVRF
jgi:hypothetical protein